MSFNAYLGMDLQWPCGCHGSLQYIIHKYVKSFIKLVTIDLPVHYNYSVMVVFSKISIMSEQSLFDVQMQLKCDHFYIR